MDTSNPYGGEQDKKKKTPPAKIKEEEDPQNLYEDMIIDPEEEDYANNPDGPRTLDMPEADDDYEEEEPAFYQKPLGIAVIFIGIFIVGFIVYFLFLKGDPEATPVSTVPEEAINPASTLKEELYKLGIGKEAVNENNIYEQGSIESSDFRKDFVNNDSPENYVLPIEITAVNDSVSYTKHRTMTDDGIDMYWVDALYKGKKTRFTIPYYIWQTLAPQGVMDVIAEVVTDAEGKTFITSITAVPPTTKE